MSIIFVMSNSWSPMPLHLLESTVQIKSWFDDSDYIVISHIAISRFLMSIVFDMYNSRSPMPLHWLESTVQIWSWFNDCDLSRDFVYRKIGIPIAMFLWHFQNAILETPTWCPSADVTHGLTCVEYCHVSLWFVTYMCLKCWINLTLVITWLCHVFLVDVVCWRESGRRSRSHLDLTVQVQSRFHTSRFRDSWCQ